MVRGQGGGCIATERVGVWLIGARGSVATSAISGAAALAAGLVKPTGLVTSVKPLAHVPLPLFGDLVFGGHELANTSQLERAERLAGEGVLPLSLPSAVSESLRETDTNIRPGVSMDGPSPTDTIHHIQEDLQAFRSDHALSRVVVVNVSSTEPPADPHQAHSDLGSLQGAATASPRRTYGSCC